MTAMRAAVRWGMVAGAVAGTIVYELAVRALTIPDVAVWPREHLARNVALWLLGTGALALALVRRQAAARDGVVVSGVLMGAGWAWVAWGLVDQHVFHLFEIAPESSHPLFWDVVFHGAGALAAGIGWNVLDAARQREASTRTTAVGGNE